MKSSSQDKRHKLLAHFRQSKLFAKADIFIIALLLTAALLAAIFSFTGKAAGEHAEVYIDGNLVSTYALNQQKEVIYDIGITILINNGKIKVIESDCPDQICVHIGTISKAGERIICAPNKFVVVVRGKSDYDATTGRGQK